jgi:signal transduction histidine kinase
MFKKGLVPKTVTTFIAIIAVTFIIIAAILSMWFENYYFEQRKAQLDKQGELLQGLLVKDLTDEPLSSQQLDMAMNLVGSYINAEILLVDSNGIVYSVSDMKHRNLLYVKFLGKELDELRNGYVVEKRNVYSGITGEKAHLYMLPVFSQNQMFKSGIIMYTPVKLIREPLNKVYTIIWVCSLLAIIISGFIIHYFTKRIIIEPLERINYAARKISKGEVERRVRITSNDEIAELAKSFNSMADSLEKVEKNRREFISNVSHELRSPITSIKGFIGGILDGVIPRDKENYYLSVAYEEIQRLTRLVNDLLDLSTMEAGKFSLRMSEIDINEIIRLCVIKFEQKIKQKNLKVDVLLQDEHLYAAGDRDRLIQIVTNLLDNAIKYVNEGGNINITTKTKGDKVFVSIYNDGSRISEEDLKHIWDRFYKTDKSRTSKMSTGLGLPIVRNILTQLGQDIWVENHKEGVIFTFTLNRM